MNEPKPCPFCGGTDFVNSTICEDDGEVDGIWCKGCGAEAPASVWNNRTEPHNANAQVSTASGTPPQAPGHQAAARSARMAKENRCPGCAVAVGKKHNDYCHVECCPDCGGQYISCVCEEEPTHPRIAWSGEWPNKAACREFGFFVQFHPGQGWLRCDKNDLAATEDLNRLYREATWDAKQARFVMPANAGATGYTHPKEAQ